MSKTKPTPIPRKGRAGLDRARIIEAALEVIDEQGVAGLTMRRLGGVLGVDAMAIYWHFDGKAALLDGVVEHEAGRLGTLAGPLPADPIEVMVHIAAHYRRVLLDHPNLAPVLASRPLPQQDAPALISFGAQLLRTAGFADEDIPRATEAIIRFGLGYVLQEAGTNQRRAELGTTFRKQQLAIRAALRAQPGDTSVEESMINHRLDDSSRDADFARALRAMLHGLRLGLGTPPPAP